MSAPLHRTVCQLTGEQRGPSKFFEANANADELLAELELLRSKTPEWEVLARRTAQLVDTYLNHAADADQRTQLVHMASLLRHYAATAGAVGSAVADHETEAVDQWARAHLLEGELFDAQERIRRLESDLAVARGERDTAKLVGGGAR